MRHEDEYVELSGECVKKKRNDETILVNVNRLYEMMSLAMRSIENESTRKKLLRYNIQQYRKREIRMKCLYRCQ